MIGVLEATGILKMRAEELDFEYIRGPAKVREA